VATSAAAAVGLLAVGTITLFTVGFPMGWPLSPAFNLLFILIGAVFAAIGIHSYLKPRTVTVGGTRTRALGR
jgi:hypothetical protein